MRVAACNTPTALDQSKKRALQMTLLNEGNTSIELGFYMDPAPLTSTYVKYMEYRKSGKNGLGAYRSVLARNIATSGKFVFSQINHPVKPAELEL